MRPTRASSSFFALGATAFVLAVTGSPLIGCKSETDDSDKTFTRDELLDPATCGKCHVDHYAQWSGSMHAYAAEDPLFRALNARFQKKTNGTEKDACVRCHAPMALQDGLTTDGLNLDQVPAKYKGVTCYFCHTVESVGELHNNGLKLGAPTTMRGGFTGAVANPAHKSAYSDLHDGTKLSSARACGSCHDIITSKGAHIEKTFLEWQGSLFATEKGLSCNSCHMRADEQPRPIASFEGVFARSYHTHTFAAVDRALVPFPQLEQQKAEVQAFLDASIQAAVCVSKRGDKAKFRVILDNVFAGHAFPSGSTSDRRVWVELIAKNGDQIVYKSGAVEDGKAVLDGPEDPDLWLLRSIVFDDNKQPIHDFGLAKCEETRLLPPPVTADINDPRFYQRNIVRDFPADGRFVPLPETVTLRVRIVPVGYDVMDDLIANAGLDPALRAKMEIMQVGPTVTWKAGSSEPFQEPQTGDIYECATATGQNFKANKFPPTIVNTCSP